MQHKIVTATLIFIHDMFRPYRDIIRCSRYAILFTSLLVSILIQIKIAIKIQIKIVHPIKLYKNGFDLLVWSISVIFGGVGVLHVVCWYWCLHWFLFSVMRKNIIVIFSV
jgi:hypothetical protein